MNKNIYNPYASALDGLEIEDPVSAFFNFCKERESIRKNEITENYFHGLRIQYFKMVGF